jgi:hypothetical protein
VVHGGSGTEGNELPQLWSAPGSMCLGSCEPRPEIRNRTGGEELTGFALYYVFSCICGVAVLVDTFRRPHTQWVAADRNRGWWVGLIFILSFLVALGPLMGLIYLSAIAPRFSKETDYDIERFRKDS